MSNDTMKFYKATARQVTLRSGIVGLEDKQFKAREYALEKIKGEEALYKIIKPINFKAGETFAYDGEVSKSLMSEVESDELDTDDSGKTDEEKANELLSVVKEMLDSEDSLTNAGIPKTKEVNTKLDFKVSAKEIKEACEKINSEKEGE